MTFINNFKHEKYETSYNINDIIKSSPFNTIDDDYYNAIVIYLFTCNEDLQIIENDQKIELIIYCKLSNFIDTCFTIVFNKENNMIL